MKPSARLRRIASIRDALHAQLARLEEMGSSETLIIRIKLEEACDELRNYARLTKEKEDT